MQQPEWIEDSTGKITGYKTPGGADTVFPFSSINLVKTTSTNNAWTPKINTIGKPHFVLAVAPNRGTPIYALYSDGAFAPETNEKIQSDISISNDGFQLKYNVSGGLTGNFSWTVAYA